MPARNVWWGVHPLASGRNLGCMIIAEQVSHGIDLDGERVGFGKGSLCLLLIAAQASAAAINPMTADLLGKAKLGRYSPTAMSPQATRGP